MPKRARVAERGDEKIKYYYTFKKIKYLRLRVRDSEVYVSLPMRTKLAYADKFVLNNVDFIEKVKERQNRLKQYNGDGVLFLGKRYPVRYILSDRDSVSLLSDTIFFYVKRDSEEYKEKLCEKWLKSECVKLYGELLKKYYPLFSAYVDVIPKLSIRDAVRRWGSCSPSKKKIMLSLRLISRPLPAIEYVVVHEYAHFAQANHSKAFYTVVASVMPDWKKRKMLLNSDV